MFVYKLYMYVGTVMYGICFGVLTRVLRPLSDINIVFVIFQTPVKKSTMYLHTL